MKPMLNGFPSSMIALVLALNLPAPAHVLAAAPELEVEPLAPARELPAAGLDPATDGILDAELESEIRFDLERDEARRMAGLPGLSRAPAFPVAKESNEFNPEQELPAELLEFEYEMEAAPDLMDGGRPDQR